MMILLSIFSKKKPEPEKKVEYSDNLTPLVVVEQKEQSNLPELPENLKKIEFDFSDTGSATDWISSFMTVGKMFYRLKKEKRKITFEDLLKEIATELQQPNPQPIKQITDGTTTNPGTGPTD